MISILGPLTRDEVISLSGLKLQLPILIPKSELSYVADIAENLFFLSPSNKIIAKRTAEIIIKELNLERIAILSPGNGQIKSLTDNFINECRQLGTDPVIFANVPRTPANKILSNAGCNIDMMSKSAPRFNIGWSPPRAKCHIKRLYGLA